MKLPTMLLVLVVVLAIGVGFLVGFEPLQFTGVNTTTVRHTNAGWSGLGCFQGTGGSTVSGGSELLNDDEYVLSWSPTLEGQRISVCGQLSTPSPPACTPEALELRLFYEPGHTQAAILATANQQTRDFVPIGKTTEGILQAEFWLKCAGGSWVPLAVDQAKLESGIDSINREKDQVQVGEEACFTYRVGYVTDDVSGEGHSYYLHSTAQGRDVIQLTAVTSLTGRFCYRTSSQDFSSNPGTPNELRATLRNELWDKSFDVTTTIDIAGSGPTLTITSFEPAGPEQGDTVTVKWSAAPNPQTGAPLDRISIIYGFGGIERTEILPGEAREFSFVVGGAGTVRFVAIAYDEENRPSPTDSVDITVGEPTPPFANLDLFLIVLVVFLVIGVLVGFMVGRGNLLIVALVAIVFLVIGLIAAGPISDILEGFA